MLSADGEALAALVVPSPCMFKDLNDVLGQQLEGADLTLTEICAPAKVGLLRFKLQAFEPSDEVVEGVSLKVMVAPPFKRPNAPPEALSELHLELPRGAKERELGEVGGGEADAAFAIDTAYQAEQLEKMLKDIRDSKSGEGADRELVKSLCTKQVRGPLVHQLLKL